MQYLRLCLVAAALTATSGCSTVHEWLGYGDNQPSRDDPEAFHNWQERHHR